MNGKKLHKVSSQKRDLSVNSTDAWDEYNYSVTLDTNSQKQYVNRPNKGSWQSQSVLVNNFQKNKEDEMNRKAIEVYKKNMKNATKQSMGVYRLHNDANLRVERSEDR